MSERKISKRESSVEYKRLRACAYVRVSTRHEAQQYSLENQRQYYEKLIQSNPKYIFAGTYADSGISGAKKDRPGFQAMLDAARNGSILHGRSSPGNRHSGGLG